MNIWMLLAVIAMIFLVIFQIAKASEYVNVLKGEKRSREQANRINAFLMLVFLIGGLGAAYWCHEKLEPQTLFPQGSSSKEGEQIDFMFKVTVAVTGVVFLATQICLFVFSYLYQEKEGRKVFYLPHNNTIEVIWTIIPAIALTVLVVIGLRHWFKITGDPPQNAIVVEITGQQFGWTYRYPGPDGVLGKRSFKLIDPTNNNGLGQDWKDQANFDDKMPTKMFLIKDRPVKLVIGSKDVIHDVGLPHFRLKMDAVPGIPTTLWFTPKWTTKEMRERLNNPDFEFEIVCDQLCGQSHYSMRGVIEVVTQEEFDLELAKIKPNYYAAFPDRDPSNKKPAPTNAPDSPKTASIVPAGAAIAKATM
jgi:cytochrome c oxidase subunit 2